MIDENVHFRHTARLIRELIKARKVGLCERCVCVCVCVCVWLCVCVAVAVWLCVWLCVWLWLCVCGSVLMIFVCV